VLPAPSVALHLTVDFVFALKYEPEAGSHVTLGDGGKRSEAETVKLGRVLAEKTGGNVSTGGSSSAVVHTQKVRQLSHFAH
jgi:hypothetical protein